MPSLWIFPCLSVAGPGWLLLACTHLRAYIDGRIAPLAAAERRARPSPARSTGVAGSQSQHRQTFPQAQGQQPAAIFTTLSRRATSRDRSHTAGMAIKLGKKKRKERLVRIGDAWWWCGMGPAAGRGVAWRGSACAARAGAVSAGGAAKAWPAREPRRARGRTTRGGHGHAAHASPSLVRPPWQHHAMHTHAGQWCHGARAHTHHTRTDPGYQPAHACVCPKSPARRRRRKRASPAGRGTARMALAQAR